MGGGIIDTTFFPISIFRGKKVSSCPSMKGGEKTVSVCCATLVSHTFLLCYCLDGRPIRRGKRAISGIPGFTAKKRGGRIAVAVITECHFLRRRRQQVIQLAQKKCRLERCSFTFRNFCALGFPIKSSFIKKSPLSLRSPPKPGGGFHPIQ